VKGFQDEELVATVLIQEARINFEVMTCFLHGMETRHITCQFDTGCAIWTTNGWIRIGYNRNALINGLPLLAFKNLDSNNQTGFLDQSIGNQ